MLTREPDLAEHDNGGIETTAKHNSGGTATTAKRDKKGTEPIVDITSGTQADRPQSKLRRLWEELRDGSVTLFRQPVKLAFCQATAPKT